MKLSAVDGRERCNVQTSVRFCGTCTSILRVEEVSELIGEAMQGSVPPLERLLSRFVPTLRLQCIHPGLPLSAQESLVGRFCKIAPSVYGVGCE
jgi:hypothetical protein